MKVNIGNFPKGNGDRKVKVEISDHDIWNLDNTLAFIIAPALRKLKDAKGGAPKVDDDEVPEELKSTSVSPTEQNWEVDNNWFKRWDWVLGEMIFAFESVNSDWEAPFYGKDKWDERKVIEKRIQNGFELFGKYYQALWM